MDDQTGGVGPGQGGNGPEPVPVVVRPRPILEVLVEEATGPGVSDKVCRQVHSAGRFTPPAGSLRRLVHSAGFDPEFLEPFLVELVPRCSGQGLLGLATLCLELVGQTGRYRAAAEAAIAARGCNEESGLGTLLAYARLITEESSVLWWHDIFVRFVHWDPEYPRLLAEYGDALLAHRYDAVLGYLLHPDRGPRNNVASMTEVLLRTDQPGPFVARWVEWIRSGRFDGHGRDGDENAYVLATRLSHGVASRPDVFAPIADEVFHRWRWQLRNPDEAERRRGVDNLLHVLAVVNLLDLLDLEPLFVMRVQAEVLHAVRPSCVAGWESFDRAFTALRNLHLGDDRGRAAFQTARYEACCAVHPD